MLNTTPVQKKFPKTKVLKMPKKLTDLRGIGRATCGDLQLLGITEIEQLKGLKAEALFANLCTITNCQQNICVLDVFSAAIFQAENPEVQDKRCNWWYWSRLRKKDI